MPDHQPPNALNPDGGPQQLYPHCLSCSRAQGLQIARIPRGLKLESMQTVELRVPNSLLLITSATDADLPESIEPGELVTATATCLAVGTMAEDDGEVSVTMTDESADGRDALSLAGEWLMDVPAGRVAIETVLGAEVLAWPAPGPRTLVRVWVSDDTEPGRVLVEVLPTRR